MTNVTVVTDLTAVLEDRGAKYGAFDGHARIAQELKGVISENSYKRTDSQNEALEMIAHKIARIVNGDPNYADSWVDIAGYARLVADQLDPA